MSIQLNAIDPKKTTGNTKQLLDNIQSKMKNVPNVMRTMANSPAVLEGYLSFNDALSQGSLSEKLREQIAITVSEANGCEYCLSAHSSIAKNVGLNENDVRNAQLCKANDPKVEVALKFAYAIVAKRGEVSNSDIQSVKSAGYSEGEIAEIIANVSLNIFTNYFNHIAKTEIDFPKAKLIGEKVD